MVTEIQKYINCLKNRRKELDIANNSESTSDTIRQRVVNEITVLNIIIRDLEKIEDPDKRTYWSYEDKGGGGN